MVDALVAKDIDTEDIDRPHRLITSYRTQNAGSRSIEGQAAAGRQVIQKAVPMNYSQTIELES